MGVLAQAKNGDDQFWNIEISCMHSKCLQFFSFKFWAGWVEDFFHFSFVPKMFPSSFQWVPTRFPICSLGSQCCVPQRCSQQHLTLIPYVLPKVLPLLTQIGWAKGEGTPSFHRIFYYGETAQSQISFVMSQPNWLIAKKIKNKKREKDEHVRHPN